MHFSWDPFKARANLRKHGIAFEEAATVFADPLALVADDVADPDRRLITGKSSFRRILVTVFVELGHDATRIISARQATRKERARYEENKKA